MDPGDRPPLTLRHPRAVLAVAALVLAVLGVIGANVEGKLEPTTVNIPGTKSSVSTELLREHFGNSAPFAILLQGPAAELDHQGPELIRALRRDPRVSTISPWDKGAVELLRPGPRKALILADFHTDVTTAVNKTVPALERTLEQRVRPPVRATQTGFATLSRALQQESINASEQGELLAIPFLLIVLLLVFRSPIAAAIPLVFGAITVIASRGILHFFTAWFSIDAFALTVCTMIGLALGVDYALLMVSRFREELEAGKDPLEAARITRRTAGRTTMFAGSTLLLSMIVAIFVVPGPLLASLAGTVAMVVVLSVAVATLVVPPLLLLVGDRIDRWRLGPAPSGDSGVMVFVSAALKRPALAALAIGAVVLVLAAPAIGLKTGPPSTEQLPTDSPARQDAELIAKTIGPGFEAPYQVIAVSPRGPITSAKNLAALEHWQRRIAKIPGVQLVIGPAQAAKPVTPLQETGNAILASDGDLGPVKQLGKLGRSLAIAAGGVGQLRSGLDEASDGAGLLADGSGRAGAGAQLIASGLGRASGGSQRAIDALARFAKGTHKLANSLRLASLAVIQVKLGVNSLMVTLIRNARPRSRRLEKSLNEEANTKLPQLIGPARATEEQLKAALAQLQGMTVGRSDPNYTAALAAVEGAAAAFTGTNPANGQPYAAGYAGLPTELTKLDERLLADHGEAKEVNAYINSTSHEMEKVQHALIKLNEGMFELVKGGNKIAHGAHRLAKEARRLGGGIEQLSGGATALVTGIDRLTGGTEALQHSLAAGFVKAAPLQGGLRRASVRVISGRAQIRRQARRVSEASPGLFNSGYFVLSALDGAPPRARQAASSTIDLPRGGQAGAITVVSTHRLNTPGSIALNKRLNGEAAEVHEKAGLTTGVAGGAAQLNDFSQVTRARMPWVILAITLVTFLVLVAVLRAIPLAAIAVGLNLATVGVAFGILTLLFHVPAGWPLGGHHYIDAVSAVMIFGIVFGLSIDYAVFILSRMREHYDRDGDNAAAIRFSLEKTARVITGAAAIMMAVFVVFAGASVSTVSQLGTGLTVAVLLDATVVRIVLLPALMLLIGDRVWWLPRPLARALPRFDV